MLKKLSRQDGWEESSENYIQYNLEGRNINNYNHQEKSKARQGSTLFQPLQALGTHVVYIYTNRQDIHAYKNKNIFKTSKAACHLITVLTRTGLTER